MGTYTGRLQDPIAGRPGDQMIGNTLNLLRQTHGTYCNRLFKTLWQMIAAKNSLNSILDNKVIQTGTRHNEFREILLKLDLRVRSKIPFFIYLKS